MPETPNETANNPQARPEACEGAARTARQACIVTPNGPTLWDCPCGECAGIRADYYSMQEREDRA